MNDTLRHARDMAEHLMIQLHDLIAEGKDDSPEGDAIRDGLDEFYHHAGSDFCNQLSIDLYYLAAQLPNGEDERFAIHRGAQAQGDERTEVGRCRALAMRDKNYLLSLQQLAMMRPVDDPTDQRLCKLGNCRQFIYRRTTHLAKMISAYKGLGCKRMAARIQHFDQQVSVQVTPWPG